MKQRLLGIGMTSRRTRDRLVERLAREGIRDPEVLQAMREVPRHIFVDEALASRAYEDTALPIGNGQTISQPYIVARMTEALLAGRTPGQVLEIGVGCGYQTAILARLAARVYGIERVSALLAGARERLHELGVRNVRLRHGDGSEGWARHAPFDGILAAAAPVKVPEALLAQLSRSEGRLVMPIGAAGRQTLVLVERSGDAYEQHELEAVSFVPMIGGSG